MEILDNPIVKPQNSNYQRREAVPDLVKLVLIVLLLLDLYCLFFNPSLVWPRFKMLSSVDENSAAMTDIVELLLYPYLAISVVAIASLLYGSKWALIIRLFASIILATIFVVSLLDKGPNRFEPNAFILFHILANFFQLAVAFRARWAQLVQ